MANVNTYLANISVGYKILTNLEYKFLYAINHGSGYKKYEYAGWLEGYPGLIGSGAAAISNAVLTSQTFTHTLSYNADLTNNLHLDATAGFEYWKSDYSNNTFSASGFNTQSYSVYYCTHIYTQVSWQTPENQILPSTYVDPTTELQSYFGRVILILLG